MRSLLEVPVSRLIATVLLPLGTIRLAERAEGDIGKARSIAEAELKRVPWLGASPVKDLFLVGGTFRALARIHIAQTGYPLAIVHHYAIRREEARDLAGVVMNAPRKSLERMPAAPTKRVMDLPFAAVVMRRLLRASGAARVVFSANGLREGWYGRRLHAAERLEQLHGLVVAGRLDGRTEIALGEPVGHDRFFEETKRHSHQSGFHVFPIVRMVFVELVQYVLRPFNRPGYQLRIKHHIKCINQSVNAEKLKAKPGISGLNDTRKADLLARIVASDLGGAAPFDRAGLDAGAVYLFDPDTAAAAPVVALQPLCCRLGQRRE